MPTYISFVNWTEQGIKNIKDSPNRSEAARALLRDMGGEIKDIYYTSGQYDFVVIAEAADGDVIAKFLLAAGALGNVRTQTSRAFTEEEFQGFISDLP